MGREARANAALWRPVTNRDVASTADPDCKMCGGDGRVTVDGNPAPCACAKDRFYRTYAGRIRRGGDGRMEFKPLVSLAMP